MKHSLFTVNINDINYVLKFWLKATWDHKWNFVLTLWILNFNKSYLLHIKEPNQSLCVIVIILANTHIVWWLIYVSVWLATGCLDETLLLVVSVRVFEGWLGFNQWAQGSMGNIQSAEGLKRTKGRGRRNSPHFFFLTDWAGTSHLLSAWPQTGVTPPIPLVPGLYHQLSWVSCRC